MKESPHKNQKATSSDEELYQKYNPQLLKITQEINRLHSQKAALLHKQKIKTEKARKARTRSLIKLGGLECVARLDELCNIELGKDLQTKETMKENVELLLGLLIISQNNYPTLFLIL
ncbi:MAG: hypothetical protein C0425_11350 [Chlorobiaceae bacterium]|nr:hypothetical protein [Chlorobiaceae bacterium]